MELAAVVPTQPTADRAAGKYVPLVVALFFIWGFCTVLVDTLIPKLKGLFALSYTEVMLTQFCFFLAYLVVSIPAAKLLMRVGYTRLVVAGLGLVALGAAMFSPAASLGLYPVFLLALFILAGGITMLQVAANPLMALLGDPAKSHSRLTIAQAFNSLGTTVGPWFGAALILGASTTAAAPDPATTAPAVLDAYRRAEAHAVQFPVLGIAVVMVLVAAVFWLLRNRITHIRPAEAVAGGSSLAVLRAHPQLALGVVSIFLYVGAEVSIGSVMTNYLMQPHTLGLVAARAGQLVSLYWGGAMVGRFIGSFVLRHVPAGKVLAACALGAAALATASGLSSGLFAGATIIAVGLMNSIMFPTIFTLGIEGLGDETPQGSGLLCMAIVGGAIVPLITGFAADHLGLSLSLLVPAVCYLWIAFYGWTARGAPPVSDEAEAPVLGAP
jgi:FHS family L-fucose permease-like MFS transporter